jgi:DNA-binding beta-propeller fold protein YncE
MVEAYRVDRIWGTRGTGAGEFNDPCGVAVDGGGNVYIPDRGNHRVQKFTSNGTFVTQWGTSQLNWSPRGLALDNADNVYIIDASNDIGWDPAQINARIERYG